MTQLKELNKIKKLYGEKFMHLCRKLFPVFLEQEGFLTKILMSTFSTNSRTLYEDISENRLEGAFKDYIYKKANVEIEKPKIVTGKTPYELFSEAGYDLYECHTEKDIQKFRKYYKSDEELCTFQGGRLNRCVVFWAIKKGAEKLKREDFKEPKREDEYGSSVLGIQFSKIGGCIVSIKSRYNHTVYNPDATFGNDLDRIVPGLTQSFAELLSERGLVLDNSNIEEFYLPSYTVAADGKYYKYNMEIKGIYYCPGNVILNHGRIERLEPEKKVLMDYFILDKENKTLRLYDTRIQDSFVDEFNSIEKIEMRKSAEKWNGIRVISIRNKNSNKPVIIEIDKDNKIRGYKNQEVTRISNGFLTRNEGLDELYLQNLLKISNDFLFVNRRLSEFYAPNLREIGNDILFCNRNLCKLNLPNLEKIGNCFLYKNRQLNEFYAPNLIEVGSRFLECNKSLSQFYAPNLNEKSKERMKAFLRKNLEKNKFDSLYVEPKDIAELDKESKITSSEINNVQKVLEDTLKENIEKELVK